MLERPRQISEGEGSEPLYVPPRLAAIEWLRQFVQRYFWQTVLTTFVGMVLAVIYALTATPVYTARAQVLIETEGREQPTLRIAESRLALDTPQVESQLALVRSEQIAEKVARRFNLDVDPREGVHHAPLAGVTAWVKGLLPTTQSNEPPGDEADVERQKLRSAITTIHANMDVRRIGVSHVLEIEYNSPSPTHAAKMTNAIAAAYVEDRRLTRAQAAQRGSEWLEARIDELRIQMNLAALAVQEFRARRDYRIIGRDAASGQAAGEVAENKKAAPPTLEELRSRADTYREIYESYLQAYTESVQRQSYPVTNARVITEASEPKHKTAPRRAFILVGGIVLGGMFGIGLALMRTALDYRVSTPNQLREELGVECLGVVPRQDMRVRGTPKERIIRLVREISGFPEDDDDDRRLREVADIPMSRFSRGIKNIRTAMSVSTKGEAVQVIGITSSVPREGKTTFAGNLATLQAQAGARTLLIDADIHNPSLTRAVAPDCTSGLLEVLAGEVTWQDTVVAGHSPFPDILPLHLENNDYDVGGALKTDSLLELFAELRESYELIVVDLPPLHPVAEALAVGPITDAVVLVAEWEVTPMPALANSVSQLRRADVRLLGVILTKVMRMNDDMYVARIRGQRYTG